MLFLLKVVKLFFKENNIIYKKIDTFLIFLTPISDNLIKSMHDTNKDIKLLIDKNYTSSIGLRTLWLSIGIQNLNDEPILGSGVGSYKNLVTFS